MFLLTNTRVCVCVYGYTCLRWLRPRPQRRVSSRAESARSAPKPAVSPDDFETASKRQQNTVSEYKVFQAVWRKSTDDSGSTKCIPPAAKTGVNKLRYGRTIVKPKRYYFRTVWKRRNIYYFWVVCEHSSPGSLDSVTIAIRLLQEIENKLWKKMS